ncbi:MAG TPA: FkbM family methyltransferase [Gemmatimonadaceae bacterium]|jgi:FkbM family methyltransferase
MPTLNDYRSTYAHSLAFLTNRNELPFALNARGLFGCGVEIGVQRALYSAQLLGSWKGAHLISVDPWSEAPSAEYIDIANVKQAEHDRIYAEACARLAAFGSRSTIWRETSTEAAQRVPHHSLDFVYIDARHDYASVLEDLEAWFDKVRSGGVFAGHDYIDGVFPAGEFGVKSAVDEFFGKRGISVFATSTDGPFVSWMVQIPSVAAEAASSDESVGDEPSMPGYREEVTIGFQANGRAHQVKLALDRAQMSQRIMLDSFNNKQMYEPDTSLLLMSVLRDGDTFVDVGTHVGLFSSLAASLVGDKGRVVSFEPEARNFRQLNDHVALNGFKNVQPINAAVAAEEGEAEFWVNADNDGGHALWNVGEHGFNQLSRAKENRRIVPVTTLDSQFANNGAKTPKLIKIDAEGCELSVLKGAKDLLAKRVPYVVCEVNHFALKQMGTSEPELRAFMAAHGYETNAMNPETGEIIPMRPDQNVIYNGVFNLLFRHSSAPAVGAAA